MSNKAEVFAITNSERKDRSIRLWGGMLPNCTALLLCPLPFFAAVNDGSEVSCWQSAGSWRWNRAMCVS